MTSWGERLDENFAFFLPKPQVVFNLSGNINELALGCRNLCLFNLQQPTLVGRIPICHFLINKTHFKFKEIFCLGLIMLLACRRAAGGRREEPALAAGALGSGDEGLPTRLGALRSCRSPR